MISGTQPGYGENSAPLSRGVKVLWARSGDIFARARHLPAQSLSVYKIREGFAQADNEAIVKIAPLPAHKKKEPRLRGVNRGLKDRSSEKPFLFYFYRSVLQGDRARAPLAAITTWMIRKNISSIDILPPPWEWSSS
jgi:hypothetical protein